MRRLASGAPAHRAQLTLWRQHRLITDEEFAAFSPQIRSAVAFLLGEAA